MIIGYSFFAGDLFHVGHLNQLEQNKSHCDLLIAGILSDEAVASYKRVPIIPLKQRMRIFEALKVVDMVVSQPERDPTSTLQLLYNWGIKTNVLFHADNWDDVPGTEWIEKHGGKLIQPPYMEGISTTMIIEKIRGEHKK